MVPCCVALFFLLSPFSISSSFSLGKVSRDRSICLLKRKATWSDSKAVQDYQNFLQSGKQEIDLKKDVASVIIKPLDGSTALAEALVEMGKSDDIVLTPGQDLPPSLGDATEYPIYITLPPWQIESFLQNLPDNYRERNEDFVFFSGGLNYGNIEDVLKDRGYCRDQMTQVLVSGMGIPQNRRVQDLHVNLGVDANGENKLAGECAACGKWAGAIAERMERSNIFCRVDFYREWRRRMWERTVFDAAFHVVGAIRDTRTTVADVANYYGDEVSDIVWQMSQLLRGWKALTLLYGFEERIFGIAEFSSAGSMECTLNEDIYPFLWGNYVFLESRAFVEYLTIAQEKGYLKGVQLPEKSDEEYTSKMRQGNLRADGVI